MSSPLFKKRIMETPLMEPVDAVKLAYQSEFGCGHLLAPEEVCAQRIAKEITETPADCEAPAFLPIGGGLCRMNLHAPLVRALDTRILARMMAVTAQQVQGSMEGFEQRLDELRALCREGASPFSLEALNQYLEGYKKEGYPPVSHSERYRAAYAPAYRVVLRGYGDALPIITAIQQRLAQAGRVILALDGDCGGGKTTLAALIAPLYQAPVIPMDDFFLPENLRTAERLAEPGGNVHFERFQTEVLERLSHETPFSYARYDCQSGAMVSKTVSPAPVTLIEGSYSHHPAFEQEYERLGVIRVFVVVEEQEQLSRLENRNPALLSRFQREWIPLEKTYFQAYHIHDKAEIVLESEAWEERVP